MNDTQAVILAALGQILAPLVGYGVLSGGQEGLIITAAGGALTLGLLIYAAAHKLSSAAVNHVVHASSTQTVLHTGSVEQVAVKAAPKAKGTKAATPASPATP